MGTGTPALRKMADVSRCCTVAFLLAAAAPAAAQTEPPAVALAIEIDVATGAFSADAVLGDPSGDVVLPGAEWLTVQSVALAGDAPATVHDGDTISEVEHGGRDLRLVLSGSLPPPSQVLDAVAWSPEALYAIGSSWFPRDDVDIRAHDLTVTIDAGRRVAATGTMLGDEVFGEERRVRFAFTGRSEDLAFFAGPYVLDETDHRGLVLRTYFETGNADLSRRYSEAVARYLDRYEAEVGDYPYDGFSVVSAPIPVGIGFAGLTYVSRDILAHPYMTGRSLAHEVLHSWWGNAVGVEYRTGNWAEGLTTFQADYALAEDQGPEAARDMRIGWVRDLALLPEERIRPLTAFRSFSHAGDQAEGYGKAAMVFHMLRDEIGAEVFQDGIRHFYHSQLNAVAGWRDLEASFEAVSGRELGWFFEQWVERPGLPRIALATADITETEGDVRVRLVIDQDAPSYRLRVPLAFELRSGAIETRFVDIEGPTSTVEMMLPERPRAVVLDPEFDLARRPLDGELAPILRSLDGSDAVGIVDASRMAEGRADLIEALAPLLRGADLTWWDEGLPTERGDAAVLVMGRHADVSAFRPDGRGPMPETALSAATRLWVERDREGRLWAFLSFDDPDAVADDLRALRYYAGQSYVAFEDGRAVAGGVWPRHSNPGELRFDAMHTGGDMR